jgi:hypothetical protein
MTRIFVIGAHPEARGRALAYVAEAPDEFVVTVGALRRNGSQNALLHALLGEVSARVEWAGKKRSTEVWKRLLCAAWLRAEGESIELLPAVDGHGVDFVYAPTSDLTKTQFASLIEYVTAYAAENQVFESA